MALQINIDSYITVNEADDLIKQYRLSNDPCRISWEATESTDKEIYLRKACLQLESLPFQGAKQNKNQQLAFPRKDGSMNEIKIAQALQASYSTDIAQSDEMQLRMALRRSGIKSYSIGNLSETFSDTATSSSTSIIAFPAIRILSKYLCGGFRICT